VVIEQINYVLNRCSHCSNHHRRHQWTNSGTHHHCQLLCHICKKNL